MLCASELTQNRALFLPTRSAAYHLVFSSCSSLSQRAPVLKMSKQLVSFVAMTW